MGATSSIQFETEKDRDAQAVYERSLQVNKVSGDNIFHWKLLLELMCIQYLVEHKCESS